MHDLADRHDSPPYLLQGRIPSLDGLRGIAILLVLLAHVCQTHRFPITGPLKQFFLLGGVGVEIFFVLSGFLITTLMLREIDGRGRLSIRHFYRRRILRIVPAYACFLLAVAALVLIGQSELDSRQWAAALTYTVNFLRHPTWEIGHAWSLSIEEHFYLLWPLVMGFGRPDTARRIAMAVIAIGFALRWAILTAIPQYTLMAELWTFTRLDGIAFGCFLALLAHDVLWRQRLDVLAARPALLGLAGVALLGSMWMSNISGKFAVGLAFTINAAAISMLTWAAIRYRHSLVGRLLNSRALSAIGVGSYSLYLWQQMFLNHNKSGFPYTFPQNLAFAGLAACMSYWLVERPFLRLKDRLQDRASTSEPSCTTPASLPTPLGTAPPAHTPESLARV
ncbi:MAG: acyltransferase family protein [Bacillota bacterium]